MRYKVKFAGPTKAALLKSNRENWIDIVAPYNADFVDQIKSEIQPSHRTYNPDTKRWSVNDIFLEEVIVMLKKHFDDVETDLTTEQPDNLFAQVFSVLPDGDYVDKVYHALAQAIHPDHGGSEQLMKQLNQAYQEKK